MAVNLSRKVIQGERGGPGSKKKFGLYQSPTCHGVTTFYGITKSSFMTKIWRVNIRGLLSPIQSIGGKMTENDHFRSIFSKVLVF